MCVCVWGGGGGGGGGGFKRTPSGSTTACALVWNNKKFDIFQDIFY